MGIFCHHLNNTENCGIIKIKCFNPLVTFSGKAIHSTIVRTIVFISCKSRV